MRIAWAFLLVVVLCLPLFAQPSNFVCAPDSPVAVPGGSVRLYAFPDPAAIPKPVYRWTVSSGTVRLSAGNVFNWTFDAASLGTQSAGQQTADGELRSGSIVAARCLVEVRVIAKRQVPAGSGLLPPGQTEPAGSGAYIYLLFVEPASRETELSAARSWLAVSPSVAELRRLLKPAESISTALPVLAPAGPAPTPEWLLHNYDFARARKFLERVSPAPKPGVYIVSSLQPILESRPPYLIQDLNHVPPTVAAAWTGAFLNLAAQNHDWNPEAESDLAAQMRLALPGGADFSLRLFPMLKYR